MSRFIRPNFPSKQRMPGYRPDRPLNYPPPFYPNYFHPEMNHFPPYHYHNQQFQHSPRSTFNSSQHQTIPESATFQKPKKMSKHQRERLIK